jgi:hypothetical protein
MRTVEGRIFHSVLLLAICFKNCLKPLLTSVTSVCLIQNIPILKDERCLRQLIYSSFGLCFNKTRGLSEWAT